MVKRAPFRSIGLATIATLLLWSLIAASPPDPFSRYDPQEVQMLRDQAAANGIEAHDGIILDTLRFRDACRAFRQVLDAGSRGSARTLALTNVQSAVAEIRDSGQHEIAAFLDGLAGPPEADPRAVAGFLAANCPGF